MSKAFTRENDDEDDDDAAPETGRSGLPPGAKNYITVHGVKRMQDELRELKTKTRPELTEVIAWAASNGDRSENGDYIYGKRKLREIDRRIRFLAKRLDIAEVVDPTKITADHVLFGATVKIRDEDDSEKTYTIVGVDEVDIERGRISWVCPLASALFKAKVNDFVTFKSPKGVREIEIIAIEYLAIE